MLGKSNNKLATEIDVPDSIFEKLTRLYTPNVNKVDKLTNMSPLEVAIMKKDITNIEVNITDIYGIKKLIYVYST